MITMSEEPDEVIAPKDRAEASEEIKDRFNRHCVITGKGGPSNPGFVDAAHIPVLVEEIGLEITEDTHAGLGGTSHYDPEDMIPVSSKIHRFLHGEEDSFEVKGHKVTEISQIKWDPSDREDGFKIFGKIDGEYQQLPKDVLWFYEAPNLQDAQAAHERRERIRNRSEALVRGAIEQGKDLHEAKENDDHDIMGYNSWSAYCAAELNISRQRSYDFMNIYEKYVLELEASEDKLKQIPVKTLDKCRTKITEDNRDEFIEKAQTNSYSDLEKEMGWTESKSHSCKRCAKISKVKLNGYRQGERKLHGCAPGEHQVIIETMSADQGEEMSCRKFSED